MLYFALGFLLCLVICLIFFIYCRFKGILIFAYSEYQKREIERKTGSKIENIDRDFYDCDDKSLNSLLK